MNFTDFNLHPDILDGIDALNYTTATPIQEKTIPLILAGKDVIGIAQTGTGKTAAFILPVLDGIMRSGEYHITQALIIVPTRELAMQIDQVVGAYAYFSDITSMAVYGGGDGKSFAQEKNALTSGADIIIATPGRLIAHINMGYVDFSHLRYLVLDEADRMLDMGFMPDLQKIIDKLNPKRQNMLFSATMPNGVMKLAKGLMHQPETVSIALSKPAEGVTQAVYFVSDRHKLPLITEVLKDKKGERIIVFSSTKQVVSALYKQLVAKGLSVGQISSDLEQEQREVVMLAFRNRQIDVLVATDVVSRGIDIDGIDMVVNFDIPRDAEDYVHRIGRTARAAKKGAALTLVAPKEERSFKRIEQLIGRKIDRLPLPARFAHQENPLPESPEKGNRRPQNRHKRPSHKRPDQRTKNGPPAQ